jgi:hypothetical protein
MQRYICDEGETAHPVYVAVALKTGNSNCIDDYVMGIFNEKI